MIQEPRAPLFPALAVSGPEPQGRCPGRHCETTDAEPSIASFTAAQLAGAQAWHRGQQGPAMTAGPLGPSRQDPSRPTTTNDGLELRSHRSPANPLPTSPTAGPASLSPSPNESKNQKKKRHTTSITRKSQFLIPLTHQRSASFLSLASPSGPITFGVPSCSSLPPIDPSSWVCPCAWFPR